jgi:exonuclease VII large subunit
MAHVEEYAQRLRDGVVARLNSERLRLERLSAELGRSSMVTLSALQHRLDMVEEGIKSDARRLIQSQTQRLESLKEIVESHNPQNILRLGFAIVRDDQGRSIDLSNIAIGENVNIELSDGSLRANVTDKKIG